MQINLLNDILIIPLQKQNNFLNQTYFIKIYITYMIQIADKILQVKLISQSNKFEMSMESDRIRQKFRQQIRTRQIQDLMRVTRTRKMSNEKSSSHHNIFMEMNQKIINSANMPIDMTIIEQLIDLMEKYPEHQNTYALLGNYLIQHGTAHSYLGLRILSMSQLAKTLQNYRWVLIIMLSKMDQINKFILDEYDQTMSQILQSSTTQLQISQCFHTLYLVLNLQNVSKQTRYFPEKYIKQFFNKITYYNMKQYKADVKYTIMIIMDIVASEHLDNKIIKEYLPEIVKILVMGFSEYPTFRYDFVVYLKRLTYDYFDQIEQLLRKQIGREMIYQLMYIHENISNVRCSILLIFESLIRQSQFANLVYLLNQGIHQSLVSTFGGSYNPQQLRLCLNVILQLFNRLNERQQKQILDDVIRSMDQRGLVKYLTRCTQERHDPSVQKILSQLLDEYFSEQII